MESSFFLWLILHKNINLTNFRSRMPTYDLDGVSVDFPHEAFQRAPLFRDLIRNEQDVLRYVMGGQKWDLTIKINHSCMGTWKSFNNLAICFILLMFYWWYHGIHHTVSLFFTTLWEKNNCVSLFPFASSRGAKSKFYGPGSCFAFSRHE